LIIKFNFKLLIIMHDFIHKKKIAKMKKYCAACFVITIMTVSLNGQVQEVCAPASIDVMDGEYNVSNNVWGDGEGVGDQCLNVDPGTNFFEVSLSTHDDPDVCSYPFIFKGCHWGWCTSKDNPLPKKISDIASAPMTWVISTEDASGTWNAAYESWFAADSTGYDYNGEMMIWIDYNGGATPGGSKVGSVNLGEHEWDVYFAEWWVNYIAYRLKTAADSVSIDIRDFIHDAVTRGYLEPEWYMHNMEAGFEIWRDGQGLTSHSFSGSVIEGVYSPVSKVHEAAIKAGFINGQNAPNPFNESTSISYSISGSAAVSIKIYDIWGREVQSLVNTMQPAGAYKVIFERNGLPDGIYIYKLYAGDNCVDTRKMIIAR
jgi:hypothetical protein